MNDNSSGFIYVLENRSMAGLLKIGLTTRTVDERVAELNAATGVPTEFECVSKYRTVNVRRVESLIHEELRKYRVNKNREFFRISKEEAEKVIESVVNRFNRPPPAISSECDLAGKFSILAVILGLFLTITVGKEVGIAVAILGVIYFIPSGVGAKSKRAEDIFVFNIVLGWTVIGWFAVLFWAEKERRATQSNKTIAASNQTSKNKEN